MFQITRIEVRGADQQQSPAVIGAGDLGQQRLVDIAGDGAEQRAVVGHAVIPDRRRKSALNHDIGELDLGVDAS
jgi:hypothetical protein